MKTIPWEVGKLKLTDEYVSGFLDGDGSIVAIVEQRPNRRRFGKRLRLRVNFSQHIRHKKFLESLQKYLSGFGSVRVVKSHNQAELVIGDRKEIESVLKRLYPHLVLKKRQAEIAIAIIKIYKEATVNIRAVLTDREFEKILKLSRAIRKLNSGTGRKTKV